jgi:hypothetical protein
MGKTMVVSDHKAVFFSGLGDQKKGNAILKKICFGKNSSIQTKSSNMSPNIAGILIFF